MQFLEFSHSVFRTVDISNIFNLMPSISVWTEPFGVKSGPETFFKAHEVLQIYSIFHRRQTESVFRTIFGASLFA